MDTLLVFFYILVSVVLVILILLQQGKGSDIGSAFGGGVSNTMFGPESSFSPLAKITAFFSLAFLLLSLAITFQLRVGTSDVLVIEEEEIITNEKRVLPDTIPEK